LETFYSTLSVDNGQGHGERERERERESLFEEVRAEVRSFYSTLLR
jgi:hypothetical protein